MAKFSFPLGALLVITVLLISSCANSQIKFKEILDGDTLLLQDDRRIRLVQIDTPEVNENECYAQEAKLELESILNELESRSAISYKGDFEKIQIALRKDSVSDDKDQYNRELRYLLINGVNVNVELVRRGAAAPYFFQGERGDYSEEIVTAAEFARKNQLGFWRNCNNVVSDPNVGISTGFSQEASNDSLLAPTDANCDPNYKGCIPAFPPDLDCADIRALGLAPVYRISGDPHRLDRDGDGIGCENS